MLLSKINVHTYTHTHTKRKEERRRHFIAHADVKVIKRSKGQQVSSLRRWKFFLFLFHSQKKKFRLGHVLRRRAWNKIKLGKETCVTFPNP